MAENIHVKLPDGSVKDVPRGTSALDIAKSISPRLADAALAAQIKPLSSNGTAAAATAIIRLVEKSGHRRRDCAGSAHAPSADGPRLVDLARPLEQDAELRILTDRDPEALEVYRHSSAHLMAAAVLELFPETKLGHGPATESGFFYDFYREKPFTPEDLEAIEKKMQELVKQDLPYAREFLPRTEGLERFKSEGDFMKCHFIEQFTAARREDFHLQDRQVHRLLPRPAHPVHRAHQGVQGAQHRRRLLAGRREKSAAPAHLRHLVLLARRISTTTCTSWKKPRSATIACWASSSTCSPFRSSPGRA